MQIVDQCRLYPARCAVFPQLGGTHPLGYVDTFQDTPSGERVYVSVYALGVLAESVGYVRAGDESAVLAENRSLAERVGVLERELAEASESLGAVRVLKQAGFAQANPPGRPRKAAA
jgi:hypothetical protein